MKKWRLFNLFTLQKDALIV